MNAPLRKAGLVLVILFGLLFAQLNWISVVKADQYRNDTEHNAVRLLQQDYERQRGNIVVDGKAIALSTSTMDTFKYLRSYPQGPLYADVTGYRPVYGELTGIEAVENQILNGSADEFAPDRLLEMLTGKKSGGGNVLLSLRQQVQQAAYDGLRNNPTGSKVGAVVAIDPTTGAVLAMVSTPSFDPNKLVVHDFDKANTAYESLLSDPANPLLNRAVSETFPPGSAFKVIVSAAALQNGLTPDTVLTGGSSYTAPQTTTPIHNSSGVNCPDQITLQDALRISCNTAFARYGVEQLGADKLKEVAQSFGFETTPTFDQDDGNKMHVASSTTGPIAGPGGATDPAALAQSCIGQRDVRWTPLQAALVAATVANNGSEMRPYLIDSIQDANLAQLWHRTPAELHRPLSEAVTNQLRQMMDSVVDNGTGTRAQIDGFEVGGKTGTAQNGDAPDHGWFIGYARTRGGQPVVAVAVLIQNAGSGASAAASAIAGQVMKAAIAVKGVS
ncbi:MAG TPA: penicillin-binding transpeptidase domain-containing protein [Micromonosporaceae bacterium]|jgi:peptidoglycan glycosyltransferase